MNNTSTSTENTCPVCLSAGISVFVEIPNVPVHCNLLFQTRYDAIHTPRGNIRLGFCRNCGHLFNTAFNPEIMAYGQEYENSLHFSPRFQDYARSLAQSLRDRYDLHGKDIIEIGCGKGDFLRLLCEMGGNRGVGFDPGYVPEANGGAVEERLTFVQEFYSERHAEYKADLICCRHVLEHIHSPREFLENIRRAIGNRHGTMVFFEVPNVSFTLRQLGIWDLIYEHYSYFSSNSLAYLFSACGFDVRNCTEAFAGQYLCIEAAPANVAQTASLVTQLSSIYKQDLERMTSDVTAFAEIYRNKVQTWRRSLEKLELAGQKTVVWGAGSKGVTFLNTLQIQDQIACVVDINPRKHGKYIAGSGQEIVPPEFLADYKPDVVVVMNPIYVKEIEAQVKSMNLSAELMSV
jgi:SAM-dependent methyltransferase